MPQKILHTIASFFTMTKKNSAKAEEFIQSIDDNFTELYSSVSGVPVSLQELELNVLWKLSRNTYTENVFTGSDLTQVNIWTSSAKVLKLFTKNITYTNGNPTTIVLTDNISGKKLTTTIAYSGSEVLNVTKVVS